MASPRSLMTRAGTWLARPGAFALFAAYVAAWLIFSRESLFVWHAIATAATWAMTLFIQSSEHRDTQAIHAKLDEILRARGEMNSQLTHVDDQEPEEIEQLREKTRSAE